jgi:hypothetical protein
MSGKELKLRLEEEGYEGTVVFEDYDYASAFLGVTDDGRAVYEYGKMIDYLMEKEGWDYETAAEWIDFNTVRALEYQGKNAPIIIYGIE